MSGRFREQSGLIKQEGQLMRTRSEFGTREIDSRPYLGIRAKAKVEELGTILGPLFGEVYGYIQQQGQQPAGMPMTVYHSMDDGTVDFQCGMPVPAPMAGTARIEACELPSGKVATVTHFGPYDELGQTWGDLTAWMESEGLEAAGVPWEVYVTDPGEEPDQSKWRTDIFFPVR